MNLQNLVDYCQEHELPDIFSGASVPAPLNLDTVKSAIMVRCGLLTPLYGEPSTFRNLVTHWFTTKQWTFEHLIKVIQAEYSPIENVFEDRTETTTYGSSKLHTGGFKDAASGKDTTTHSSHDYTERTYNNFKEDTERTYNNYKDDTERTYTNYHNDTERTHTNYKETTDMSGSHVTESQVSAFNSSGYQPSTRDGETFGVNLAGNSSPRQDEKSITGSYKDANSITGSYKDSESITGSYKDSKETTGSYKDDTTFGHKIELDNGKTLTRTYQDDKESHVGKDELTMHRAGNIGVTSAMSLIEEELALLRHFDIYNYIAELFENDNMLMIY